MNKELLKNEILIQCQNVQCGAKLAAEIHYIYNKPGFDDVLFFEKVLKHFPELKYLINFHPDEKAKKDGWKSIYIYKYWHVEKIIKEIESIKDKNSVLYHFTSGKLFGYNDYEVMQFINKS